MTTAHLFSLRNSKKTGQINVKNAFGFGIQFLAQSFIAFSFGHKFSFRCISANKHRPTVCSPLTRFSPAQAELYEAVLEVQRSCLSLCSPGVSLDHIYSTMLALLGRQLRQLGIIKASTSDADVLKVIVRSLVFNIFAARSGISLDKL